MGLVQFKNRKTGAVVEANFPLAEPPELVAYTDDQGVEQHMIKADFASQFAQVLPELPKTDASTVPEIEVARTAGSPLATPAAPSKPEQTIALNRSHLEAIFSGLSADLKNAKDELSGEVFKLHDRFARLEALLESLVKPTTDAPPPPPAA